jgi:hypothetical protein
VPPARRHLYLPPPISTGIGDIIVGSIFLPLGVILLGTSAILWNECGANNACFNTSDGTAQAAGATTMDVFGGMFVVMGAILLPIGIVKAVKFSRYSRGLQRADAIDLGHGISLGSSSKGLTLHF